MEEEDVRLVCQQASSSFSVDPIEFSVLAASLADGRHTIVARDRRWSVRIVSLDDEGIVDTTLVDSLYRPPKASSRLIDHVELTKEPESRERVDFARLLKRVAELFAIPWVEIDAETAELSVDFRKPEALDHVTPAVGFLEVGPFIRLLYHDFGQRELLKTYTLHAFQNIQTSSKRFNLLLFQLFESYSAFLKRSIFPIFSTEFISADPNLWLTVDLDAVLQSNRFFPSERVEETERPPAKAANRTRLWEQTEAWRCGELSNFDYLMLLNEYSGRVRNDPNRHPILPWVCDFSSPDGLRDLTRTKYRLAKGDAQLHETFKRQQLAHHIPELLTEICFFVYRARVESKADLCRHVRSQFIPQEYPSNMRKLFEWSPDECIPEFFESPEIFSSIHEDLPDLQLPEWTKTPAEFARWHREKLESDEVSSQLHHWIDLVYGYKLAGEAAVEALNVHLCFVRRSAEFRTAGAVQLFTRPHPKRIVRTKEVDKREEEIRRFYPAYAEENLPPNATMTPVSEGASFDLLGLIQRIYAKHNHVKGYVEKSAMSVGVTIVELALPEFTRDLGTGASFDDRLKRAQSLLNTHFCKLPRHIRKALRLLLKVEGDSADGKRYSFSSSMLNFFSLPYSVVPVHRMLVLYHANDHLLHNALINDDSTRAREFFLAKIEIVWNGVEFTDFNPLWRDLFVEMLQELKFAILVCDRLFSRVIQYADGDEEDGVLRSAIIRLFEYNIPDLAVLFDRRFLLQLCIRFGSDSFLSTFLPLVVEAVLSHSTILHDVAKESILWLAKRYGPIVTGTKITPCVLRLLSLCFAEPQQLQPEFEEISLDVHVAGDDACDLVVDILSNISFIYGPAFITLHYVPYAADLIDQAHRRLTPGLESAVIVIMRWMEASLNCLSDRQLMDNLKEIVGTILYPAVRLFCSTNVNFSNDRVRRLYVCKAVRLTHLLGCRIGQDNTQKHLSSVILRVFCTFNLLFDFKEADDGRVKDVKLAKEPPKQLVYTFTPAFAKLLLHHFSLICSRQYLTAALPNTELVAQIAASATAVCSPPPASAAIPIVRAGEMVKSSSEILSCVIGSNADAVLASSPSSHSFVASMSGGGNRLSMFQVGSLPAESPVQEHLASAFDPNSNLTLNGKMTEDSVMHLADSWVCRFRAVLSATSDSFAFDQLSLVDFKGHTGAVRRIFALDNENSFITGSADKTVRLWSIKTTEESSVCQWTYKNHTKAISDLTYLPAVSIVASACSNLHCWDPFRGSTIHQPEWPTSTTSDHSIVAVCRMNHGLLAIGANSENVVRTLDTRTGWYAHHYCASSAPPAFSNGIRAMAVSESSRKIVVALNNGQITLIDSRMGKILGISVLQHADVTQVVWLDEDHFTTVHSDHPAIVWQANPRLKVDRKLNETAAFVARCSADQFLTLQSSKLRLYRRGECHNETRLRSEFIPGSITTIEPLPLNRMFLIGSSNGNVRLAC